MPEPGFGRFILNPTLSGWGDAACFVPFQLVSAYRAGPNVQFVISLTTVAIDRRKCGNHP